ncbi:hypothetical protein [Arcanobacterium canis]
MIQTLWTTLQITALAAGVVFMVAVLLVIVIASIRVIVDLVLGEPKGRSGKHEGDETPDPARELTAQDVIDECEREEGVR